MTTNEVLNRIESYGIKGLMAFGQKKPVDQIITDALSDFCPTYFPVADHFDHDSVFDYILTTLEGLEPYHKAIVHLIDDFIEYPAVSVKIMLWAKSKLFPLFSPLYEQKSPISKMVLTSQIIFLAGEVFSIWLHNPDDEKILSILDQKLKDIEAL